MGMIPGLEADFESLYGILIVRTERMSTSAEAAGRREIGPS